MPVRTPLMACVFYTLVTAVLGRHVLAELGSSIAKDPGDPLLTAAILHWNARHLPLTDAWWQFPIFYPTRDALAFSEHLLGVSVLASPISWLTGNSLTTYNLTLLLTFPLCAMAMYALVYRISGSAAGAFVAGLAYGFAPYRVSTLSHIQMLTSFWAPLALLGLHAYVEADRPRRRWLLLYGAAWLFQALANGYMLIFFSVLIGLWIFWFVVVPARWRALKAIAAATAIVAMPMVPILYKYVTVHARHGFERGAVELHAFSADLAAVLCAPSTLTFWGWLRVGCRAEGELFPGVAAVVLFAVGILLFVREPARRPATWVVRLLLAVAFLSAVVVTLVSFAGPQRLDVLFIHLSASRATKPLLVAFAALVLALLLSLASRGLRASPSVLGFYLVAAIVTWLLALGPMLILMGEQSGRPGPFVLLQWLPGTTGVRVPARFWLLTVLSVSAVAGITIGLLQRTLRPRSVRVVTVLAASAILADSWTPGIVAAQPPPPVPGAPALRGQVVLQLPLARDLDIVATWRAVVGGWTSVNGFSGYAPNYYLALTQAGRAGDEFAPFRRGRDLRVVALDGERIRQYQLAALDDVRVDTTTAGIPIAALHSRCEPNDLRFALDRDPRTNWQCATRDDQELTLDLAGPATVSAVVYSLGPFWWNAPDRLLIATSRDGQAWEDAPTESVLDALIEGGLRHPRSLAAVLQFTPREARYILLRGEGTAEPFLFVASELEVRGPQDR